MLGRRVGSTALLLALCICTTVQAVDKEEATQARARKALEQFQRGRDELKTGIASVQQVGQRERQGKVVFAKTNYFLAFDYPRGRLRFDFKMEEEPFFASQQIRKDGKIFLGSGRKAVTIRPGDFKSGEYYRPFDVRSAGLLDFSSFVSDLKFDNLLHDYKKAVTVRPATSETSTLNGKQLDRLALFVDPDSKVKYTIWFDPELEYAPVRWERPTLLGGKESLRVGWEKIEGAYVPTTMRFEEIDGTTIELNFKWESVNQAVGDEVFNLTAIANEGAFIFDYTQGVNNQPVGVVKAP